MFKERDLPEKVVCLDCNRDFNLLHRAHLRIHGYENQAQYRETHQIVQSEPLHSREYSEVRSYYALLPQSVDHSRKEGLILRLRRRAVIESLAEKGLFTPSSANILTGIPLTTLQAAMQESRLPYGLACLRIPIQSGFANGGLVKIVEIADLYRFVRNHKPKRKG